MNQDIEVGIEHRAPASSRNEELVRLSPLNSKEQGLLATYDFTKHTSMLSLVAMGGMLALLQGTGEPISKKAIVSIVIVGLAGFLSMGFMAAAAATQISQRAHKTSKWLALGMVYVILIAFSAGIGMFFKALTIPTGH